MDDLNKVDLAFIVDTTGSMGPFIDSAKRQLIDTIETLSAAGEINLSIGIVEYEDYCDKQVTRVHDFTTNLKSMQKVISAMKPGGGGDTPEAVYAGVNDACTKLQWRDHSVRLGILVGDAPPHAFPRWYAETFGENKFRGGGDSHGERCPSGLNPLETSAICEKTGMTLYGICMGKAPVTAEAFKWITGPTGGKTEFSDRGDVVVEIIAKRVKEEFHQLTLDRKVFEFVRKNGENSQMLQDYAKAEEVPYSAVVRSLARLHKRDLLSSN